MVYAEKKTQTGKQLETAYNATVKETVSEANTQAKELNRLLGVLSKVLYAGGAKPKDVLDIMEVYGDSDLAEYIIGAREEGTSDSEILDEAKKIAEEGDLYYIEVMEGKGLKAEYSGDELMDEIYYFINGDVNEKSGEVEEMGFVHYYQAMNPFIVSTSTSFKGGKYVYNVKENEKELRNTLNASKDAFVAPSRLS